MNNDLISRSALLAEYRDFKDMDCPSGHTVTADYMIELVEDAPAVDAEVVRHGRWTFPWTSPECSACRKTQKWTSNYCPHCGAKMRGNVDASE